MNYASGAQTRNNDRPPDLSNLHLQAELARLDLLLKHQISRWRAAGQDPTDAFRGLYIGDDEASGLLDRPLGGSWADLSGDDTGTFQKDLETAGAQILAFQNAAAAQGNPTRLETLVRKFELSPFDKDVLLLSLAPTLDLRYQRIYGYLQDDVTKKLPCVNLALDLFASPSERTSLLTRFDSTRTLYKNHLLLPENQQPLLSRHLQIDPHIAAWLLGNYCPENLLPFDPADAEQDGCEAIPPYNPKQILSLTGPDHMARKQAARYLSARSEKPLLTFNVAPVSEDPQLIEQIHRHLRDACLMDAIPEFTGWDAIAREQAPPENLLSLIFSHPDLVIISSLSGWRSHGVARDRRIYNVDFPIPAYKSRLKQWSQFLSSHPEPETLDLRHLAGQFALTTGQIRDAFASACDSALQRGSETINQSDLLSAARSHSNPRLGALARKIEARFQWSDIVLPEEQITILREITATVRQRPRVLDEWGVGEKLASSRGVTVLFAGPPGTGKTMAAEIMSADLGLDLYKIDLSGVVSKYIGETEKNLEKVFEEAATSNAILFFDEADSLFGKRSEVRDAHDRYANLEISYLLQRMEAYDGVTILATNLRANLDEAFTRRLQFAVDFPFPEEDDRLRIWIALLPPKLPMDPRIDFSLLAGRFRIAGGNIRNVIINAAYLAAADGGTVTMSHLLHGTRRELQKMGRLLNEKDLEEGSA